MKPLIKLLIISFLIVFASEAYAQYVPKDKRKKKEAPVDTTAKPSVNEPQPNPNNENSDKTSEVSQMTFAQRLTKGGNFWMQFGNFTRVDVQPLLGYRFTDKLTAGLGVNYQYYNYYQGQFEQSYYGGRSFVQYRIVPEIFLWGEMDGTNGNYYNQETYKIEQKLLWSPLLGGGYTQSLGRVGGFNLTVLYNFNWNNTKNISFYSSPWVIRTGFMF